MPFWEDDLDIFFADFNTEAVFNPDAETPLTIKVLFDSPDLMAVFYGDDLPNQYHELTAKAAEVAEVAVDDPVRIKGTLYKVNYRYEDETGLTKMRLRRA